MTLGRWACVLVAGLLLVGLQGSGVRGRLAWAGVPEEKPAAKPEVVVEKRAAVTSVPQLPAELNDALQGRKFDAAVTLIDTLLKAKEGPKVPGDYLLYQKARALTELDKLDVAVETYLKLEKDFPKSPWLSRSRFGRGWVLAKQRNYQAAAVLYKAETERLLSSGRTDELTGIYVEYADRYFTGEPVKGPTSERKPDYQQALGYYQQALQLKPSRPLRQKLELRVARCHQELNQVKEATEAYQAFLKLACAPTLPEDERAPAALEAEAQYQLGRLQLAAGQTAEARKTWQDFLAAPALRQAGGPLVAEATYRLAQTYGMPQPPTVGDMELGVAQLQRFIKEFPEHALTVQAELDIALGYVHHGRQAQALAQLKALIANPAYAKAVQIPSAWHLLGQVYAGQKQFDEAIATWRQFLEKYPTDPKWSEVQRVIIDTEYTSAFVLYQDRNYDAARKAFETFLNKYPLDARAAQILYLFGEMRYVAAVRLAKPEPPVNDEPTAKPDQVGADKLFQAAIEDWQRLVSKYPGTGEASRGALMIGKTLEHQLHKLPEALEAYRKVAGPFESQAQQAIASLTAKQLEVVTERKFRSNEKPSIKLTTRNIETLSVKIYRIDMQDYFRKLHLASGVETLDIALIDPDKAWDQKVEAFENYRRIEQQVEIPIEGPGVTAVTVSSDTLETTTMVVVSDIDLIVKSSRNELFVFAQNMREGKPAEGVSLLVSDGAKVFAEGVTGKDGVLQKSYEELKSVKDLRVFAEKEGHAASSQVNLEGLQFAVGLSPKGYLYTDRPAYRAGQLVNLKGIIRWVENDRYVFKAGEKYRLDVYDARGRVLHTAEIALGDFGSFAAHFSLPASAPQGDYRVHLHQAAKNQSYETHFTVHEYQLEPIQFTVDLPQTVYFRGEHVKGKFILKYYYGTPIAGRAIQYRLGDDRWYNAETNAKGEVEFDLPTQRYSETQPLQLIAQYPERNLATGAVVQLATRGFQIGLSTLRPVYIAGETFDLSLNVSDPAGKPVAADLKVDVIQQFTVLPGRTGERLAETHELKVDAKTGKTTQTLRIEKSGKYLLRATGIDRFGNPVSQSMPLMISGDGDTVRLRILSDKHNYKVGDVGQMQLHWRDKPSLALVTYEGASILGYRLVELKPGANPFQLPLDDKLAPNFNLSVAVMDGSKFHSATSEFRVARELRIALKPSATTLKPGDPLTVEVTVTDPQGKPVQAELTLGLVQQNLLNMFPDQAEAIDTFFNGGARQISVRAFTSCTFRYDPRTRPINEFLLAEADRQGVQQREAVAKEELAKELAESSKATIREDAARKDFAGVGVPKEEKKEAEEIDDAKAESLEALGADMDIAFRQEDLSDANGDEIARHPEGLGLGGGIPGLQAHTMRNKTSMQRAQPRSNNLPAVMFRAGRNPPPKGPANGKAAEKRPQGSAPNNGNTSGAVFEADGDWVDAGIDGRLSDFTSTLNLAVKQSQMMVDGPGPGILEMNLFDQTQGRWFKQYINGNDLGNSTYGWGLLNKANGTIFAVNGRGDFQVVNQLALGDIEKLAQAGGLRILPEMFNGETAYWNPSIVTDKDGKAVIVLRLPERTTAWKLRSKGVNGETLGGQAEADIVTKKELFGDLQTPLAFTAGDKAEIPVEIHNAGLKAGEIEVKLKTTLGDKTTELKKTIKVTQPGVETVTFPIEVGALKPAPTDKENKSAESIDFELTVSSGELKDLSTRSVPIKPYGMPVYATSSGTSAQNTSFQIQHPAGLAVENPALEILIGPSVNRTLLDAVLGASVGIYDRHIPQPSSHLERSISDVLGGVALLKMIGQSRTTDTPEAQALAGRVTGGVSLLISSQREDGGWTWSGKLEAERSDRYLSSRAMWALSSARKAGFAVPQATFDKGVQHLQSLNTAAAESDNEGKAILLHGLAEAGAADFAHLNRLHRLRASLSASSLVHTALALIRMDRQNMAGELLDLAKTKIPLIKPGEPDSALKGCVPWMQTGVEIRALYLMALNDVQPAGPSNQPLVDWLMSARVGSRWIPEKANGPAVIALADWFGRAKLSPEKYTLTVYANDKLVEKFTVDPSTEPSRSLVIPAKLLVAGKPQRVNIDIDGRGTFSYSAVLTGFVPADKLKSTTNDWYVQRTYEPPQRLLDGEVIPRGFDVLTGSYTTFTNPVTQVPVGERCEVNLNVYRTRYTGQPNEQLDYLVVTEPIPAGTTVLTESISGTFDRYELTPGAITFYLGDRASLGGIHYTLVGYLPGSFRTAPTLVRSFYQPERIAVTGEKPLTVLNRGAKSVDEYRLSPRELFEFGKRYAAKREYAKAAENLAPLFKAYRLNDDVYRETVQTLFTCVLAANKADDIVQYFEIIKEKYPDVEVSFENILKVGNAYAQIGEYERSYLVYRATAEAGFQRESQIAGFLDERGEFLRSVQVMERLLREYPAEAYVAIATYALAQEVYGKAPEVAGNETLRKAGVTRVELIAASVQMLDAFLSTWPTDPAADQASFSLANALLDLEKFPQAIERAAKYAERYPDSKLLDSFWYIIGYSQFALGKHEQALEMCKKVAEFKKKDPQTGIEVAAASQWQAIYIMGQVYHSLGQPAAAIGEYNKVKDRFADALEAIDFFTHKALALPEVTVVKPGDPGKVALKFRNVGSANIKVYRIDLLKFSLLQRNLSKITGINLAGIRPYHDLSVKLGDGKDYKDKEHELNLPLKDEGAYLIVCQGENLYTSGLVLVSPLKLEVQEDAVSGRVRVTVKDVVADKYASSVHVKVIGSLNPQFVSGSTDLRGVFVADGILGTSTVIARVGQNRYAFHRGKIPLGNIPQPNASEQAPSAEKPANGTAVPNGKDGLLDQLYRQNGDIQREQRGNYRNLLKNKKQGVDAKEAF